MNIDLEAIFGDPTAGDAATIPEVVAPEAEVADLSPGEPEALEPIDSI